MKHHDLLKLIIKESLLTVSDMKSIKWNEISPLHKYHDLKFPGNVT